MNTAGFARYLALPLRAAPLLLVIVFSVLLTLAQSAGAFGLVLLIICVSWFSKYSFVLMDDVADGRTEPPVLSIEMVNPADEQRPLGLLLVMVAFYYATAALDAVIGAGPVFVLRLAGVLLLPAIVAAMGATRSLVRGLNPVLAIGLVMRVPLAYLALLLVIAVLWLGVPALAAALGLATVVPEVVVTAALMYLWLAAFACIGGLIYEYRDELGHEPSVTPERAQARRDAERDRERDRIMDGLFAQWRAGSHPDARAAVGRMLAAAPQPLAEYRWLYARAAAWEDPRLANHLARWAVPRLLEARATGELLDVVRARLRADRDFRPATASELLAVARIAHDGGAPALAQALLQDFERHFPCDPATAVVDELRKEWGLAGERSGRQVTKYSEHIGNTFWHLRRSANAVAGVLQDGRAAAVRGSAAGGRENGGLVPRVRYLAQDRLQDLHPVQGLRPGGTHRPQSPPLSAGKPAALPDREADPAGQARAPKLGRAEDPREDPPQAQRHPAAGRQHRARRTRPPWPGQQAPAPALQGPRHCALPPPAP
jgi:hypothetical protein